MLTNKAEREEPPMVAAPRISQFRRQQQTKADTRRISALVQVVLLGNFIFSGFVFGWPPLVVMLQNEGVFAEGCPPAPATCSGQQNKLSLMFSIASTLNGVGSLLSGVIVDTLGPVFTIFLDAILELGGFILFALAPKNGPIIMVAFALLGIGGNLFAMNTFPMSKILSKKATERLMSGFNCLYSASAVVLLFVYWLYKYAGFTRKEIFLGLAVFSAIFFVANGALWHSISALFRSAHQHMTHSTVEDLKFRKSPATQSLSLRAQLTSFEFFFVLVVSVINQVHSLTYLGTVSTVLERLGDAKTGYVFTQIFSVSPPLSIPCAILVIGCLEKYGFAISFDATSIMGILVGLFSIVPSLPFQVVTFLVFVVFRVFTFAILSAYCEHTFGPLRVGRLNGLILAAGSGAGFLQWPAVMLTNRHAHGDLKYLNIALALIHVPMFLLTFKLRQRMTNVPFSDVKKEDTSPVIASPHAVVVFALPDPPQHSPAPAQPAAENIPADVEQVQL
eukprot:c11866_g1_i1.p1 GENE.c11866_g1_i1~~c11866_g1_i1.p1  ORF type:complete len:505 (-),score=99.10 c11866_g1_i1:745-2259(-)